MVDIVVVFPGETRVNLYGSIHDSHRNRFPYAHRFSDGCVGGELSVVNLLEYYRFKILCTLVYTFIEDIF